MRLVLTLLAMCISGGAAAAELNSGDTAWMLVATALVLLMTIPGLSLFYAGLVRQKNVLSVLMQCFAITAVVTVLWVAYGYSITFSTTGMEANKVTLASFVGNFDKAFFAGVTRDSLSYAIPESVFATFQLTFAIITVALIVGSIAERMNFAALILFAALWVSLIYFPLAHMVWAGAGSLLGDHGVLDFAGGTVVHINAGVAALVACIVLGKRKGYPTQIMMPHNLTFTVIGAGLLWVGWFGFNAGSAVAANASAGMAMLVTQVASAAAAIGWTAVEWKTHGKPSVLGMVTGAVAGLVAVTPASGTCGVGGALALGFIAGIVCFYSATLLKKKFGYDDSLDVFGVHGVGGIVGAILTGVFCDPRLGGAGFGAVAGETLSLGGQLWAQTLGVLVAVVFSGIGTWVLLKVVALVVPLRASLEDETEGLDLSMHNERGYNF
jgi:ammonium transporter, Amt family